ncbi:MAG TPA: hypothetical protein VLN26_02605, partial [Gaiellaceae bacterium]|nr:hypothetical protein [Gaiellaceae bacterium]
MANPRVGVVGSTGAVGTLVVDLLQQRGFDNLRLFASGRSAGTQQHGITIEEATPEALEAGGIDLALFSVGTGNSQR